MAAYYNEHDPFAAAWLRELIADGLIAPGEVDERSIEDVSPDDLRPFRQCHFFAGIGVWSLAARLVGWDDDTPLWTGSCPCQPFSAAGKGGGFTDERHLWPAFHYLIEQCGPPVIAGEQVAGRDGDAWLDLVSADVEATGLAFGAVETVACGFGAPHKRSRNYWVAHADPRLAEQLARHGAGSGETGGGRPFDQFAGRGDAIGMADSLRSRLEGYGRDGDDRHEPGRVGAVAARPASEGGVSGGLADSDSDGPGAPGRAGRDEPERHAQSGGAIRELDDALGDGRGERRNPHAQHERDKPHATGERGAVGVADASDRDGRRGIGGAKTGAGPDLVRRRRSASGGVGHNSQRPGPVNGFWRDADWLICRDEKWRPVEPGTFPLADAGAVRNRVGLLRGAGNAITVGQAAGFLRAVRQVIGL